MASPISHSPKPHPLPRPAVPGKKMITKLVRLLPEELKLIERAAASRKPKVTSSRYMVDGALGCARRDLSKLPPMASFPA